MKITGELEHKLKDIYDAYAPIVHGKCLQVLKSPDDAWDITQEVFIKLIKKYDTIENKQALLAWLIRTSTNTSISHLRKKRGFSFDEEIYVQENSSLTQEKRTVNKMILEMLIKPLDPKTKELLVYTYIDGYTQEEISEITGMGQSTIRKYLHRFKKKAQKWKMNHEEFEY